MKKIVRSICLFADKISTLHVKKIANIAEKLEDNGYIIQTKRVCVPTFDVKSLEKHADDNFLLSIGSVKTLQASKVLGKIYQAKNTSFNIDLTSKEIAHEDVKILFDIIKNKPEKTFNFTYVFNNQSSSPYFPSADYEKNGFSIGLQPTDISENCKSVDEWLEKMKSVWDEIYRMFKSNKDFLGIDSSIAPLFEGNSSFIHFLKKLGMGFSKSATTDTYLKITEFIKKNNPKPVGLCGIMLPCLEDFELANEYTHGNFPIERNIYLSLHSGLGVDTYPIGIDENPERVIEILKLIQMLSNKYKKPLSVRFVSDGKAKIGKKTDFKNQYLKDVVVRKI